MPLSDIMHGRTDSSNVVNNIDVPHVVMLFCSCWSFGHMNNSLVPFRINKVEMPHVGVEFPNELSIGWAFKPGDLFHHGIFFKILPIC